MRHINRINFDQDKTVTKLSLCLMLVGLGIFIYVIIQVVKTELLINQAQQHQLNLQRKAPRTKASPLIKQTPEQLKILASIDQQFNYPWQQYFSILEQVDMQHISLLGLEPDIVGGKLKLSAEADDTHSMFEYIKALNAVHGVNQVDLLSQEKIVENNQEKITFEAVIEVNKK